MADYAIYYYEPDPDSHMEVKPCTDGTGYYGVAKNHLECWKKDVHEAREKGGE